MDIHAHNKDTLHDTTYLRERQKGRGLILCTHTPCCDMTRIFSDKKKEKYMREVWVQFTAN
jgi:hypothetical protein